MDVLPTAILAAAAIGFTVFCGWRGALKARPLAPPRLAPWRVLMLVGFLAALMLLVHLVNLLRNH